jgi:hypothetical protein
MFATVAMLDSLGREGWRCTLAEGYRKVWELGGTKE